MAGKYQQGPRPWSGYGDANRNSGHFTRGSRLISQQYSMFWQGAKLPLIIWLVSFALSLWAKLELSLGDGEFMMIGQRALAWIWTEIGLSDQKPVNITLQGGTVYQTYIGFVPYVPEVQDAWHKMVMAFFGCLIFASFAAGLFAWFFVPWAIKRSHDMTSEHHERGAELADRQTLVRQVIAKNNEALIALAKKRFADMTVKQAFALPYAERKPYGLVPSYTIATVPFPLDREQNHVIAFGTTGTGKTTALKDLIAQAMERENSCVVFDLTGTFVESFYNPDRDFILNLNDERCRAWSVFNDCQTDGEFLAAAEALIPDVDGADGGFWEKAARTIFVEMCVKLRAEGKGTNRELIRSLMTATMDEIYGKLKGTIADPLTNPKAERMANSVRGVFNAHAKALMFLPDDGEPFSIREWCKRSGDTASILFVTSRYTDMPLNRPMLSMWMNLAIHSVMALERTPSIRAWFFFDELGALHYLPAIEDGMQSARNYGGAFVLGVHSLASLRERYGEYGATKVISLAYTKLILGTGDRDTADECSKLIGYRQVRTVDEAYSYGSHTSRDATTLSPTRKEEALVFPDDITNLKNLTGYIRFREGFPAALITMPYVDYPKVAQGFLVKPAPTIQLPEPTPPPTKPPAEEAADVEEASGRETTTAEAAKSKGNAPSKTPVAANDREVADPDKPSSDTRYASRSDDGARGTNIPQLQNTIQNGDLVGAKPVSQESARPGAKDLSRSTEPRVARAQANASGVDGQGPRNSLRAKRVETAPLDDHQLRASSQSQGARLANAPTESSRSVDSTDQQPSAGQIARQQTVLQNFADGEVDGHHHEHDAPADDVEIGF